MSTSKEWNEHKLKRMARLKGMSFMWAKYTAPSTDWDHDHCEGCSAKFAEFDRLGILHSGYFTTHEIENKSTEVPEFVKQLREQGPLVLAKPDDVAWVCKDCFEEFRQTLDWKFES